MAEPLLDFGDIGFLIKRIGGRRGSQGMDTDPAIVPHDILIDGIRMQGFL